MSVPGELEGAKQNSLLAQTGTEMGEIWANSLRNDPDAEPHEGVWLLQGCSGLFWLAS